MAESNISEDEKSIYYRTTLHSDILTSLGEQTIVITYRWHAFTDWPMYARELGRNITAPTSCYLVERAFLVNCLA